MYLYVTVSENVSLRVTVCLAYLPPRDQRHFLVLRPNRWRGKIEMTGTSREWGNWSPAFPYILQCEACFPLETQPALPQGNIVGDWKEQEGVCLCVNSLYYVHMCSSEYICVS